MNIYMLWHHDEHGPDGLVATTIRHEVVKMADAQGIREDQLEVLKSYLEINDEEFMSKYGGMGLGGGWGCWHFQIVKHFGDL